ncbi:diguanylate cyclase CdgB [Streptomyces sp. N2-109]|uniref:Diguanylate cyclase CdgB n=1 Tax=Streptomyces gossypii TaxID=2883101 RepID=A0ABT2JXZ6_9ACTN|nr:diguanylate cyclase CdgB [Streptomyces gossypii]MCT2592778.1 diguanylate cyclase CdgB [Streptomyces gossypii]
METESEPYVRLASLRKLHQVVAHLNTARSLADTLQAIADGVVDGLGFQLSIVNLVRGDGDLVVAAVAGSGKAEATMSGRVGSRESWERRLTMGERWGELRFIPYTEGWVLEEDDVPTWHATGAVSDAPDAWHPVDRLLAPLYASGSELLGVISVDRPDNGRRPNAWRREALQLYASQAAIALSNARLRANMQRALVRLEREQQALRSSEESFRQAFEYAPSGMAVAEMGGDEHGRLVRTNDALCRLLGRPASAMRRYSFSDLVHPEDIGTLLRTSAEGGRAELRLRRRDGSHVWVSLRNSVVADAADGPRFLLTHVEDIEDRKRHELQLAHRASHDSLTGLPNSAELRARLTSRLCAHPGRATLGVPQAVSSALTDVDAKGEEFDDFAAEELGGGRGVCGASPYDGRSYRPQASDPHHVHAVPPDGPGEKGLAVLFCDLDGFKSINDRYGHHCGDAVLIAVAQRLSSLVRDNDTVARLGGDEFVVLADGVGPAEAQDLAVRLRNAIIPPIRVDGRSVRVGASFGIGWAGCGMTAEEVLQSADQRMYVEKRSRAKGQRRAG